MIQRGFVLTRMCFPGRDWRSGWEPLAARGRLRRGGLVLWGAWYGLFGLAANELFMMTHADPAADHLGIAQDLAPAEILEQYELVPTARPTSVTGPDSAGLYVFRFFDVQPIHIDEIVRLSTEAWVTFEDTADYSAKPLGLFAPLDRSRRGKMLLVTWYDGFDSWVTSRLPAASAKENFARRRELTRTTVAYAVRLVGT